LLLGAACSSASSDPADAGGADSAVVGCQGQGETYAAGTAKTGTMGKYTFTLVQAAPAPPGINGNVWTLRVADASGAAPPASALSAVPYMPLMGHGTGQVPQFAANADGTFAVSNIYLFMNGLWTVTYVEARSHTAESAPTSRCLKSLLERPTASAG